MANMAISPQATYKKPQLGQRLGRVLLYLAVVGVSVLTFFPIYWMLVSTFQPSKYTLHYPPPLIPREITLHPQRPEGSAQNVFAGPILELAPEPPGGERVRVVLGTRPPLVAEVTREAVKSLGLAEGRTVHASFKATGIRSYR